MHLPTRGVLYPQPLAAQPKPESRSIQQEYVSNGFGTPLQRLSLFSCFMILAAIPLCHSRALLTSLLEAVKCSIENASILMSN